MPLTLVGVRRATARRRRRRGPPALLAADRQRGRGCPAHPRRTSLPWMLLAAVLQLFAGLAASTLAALDDYVTSAAGFVARKRRRARLHPRRGRRARDRRGRLGHGASTGRSRWPFPLVRARARGRGPRAMPATARAVRPGSRSGRGSPRWARVSRSRSRCRPIYLVCVPLAGREGTGAVTSFGYAYLVASAVVAVTASSLGLVTRSR